MQYLRGLFSETNDYKSELPEKIEFFYWLKPRTLNLEPQTDPNFFNLFCKKRLKMAYTYPHTIENGGGEMLTFLGIRQDPDGEFMEVENLVSPGSGPPMHVHHKQEESLTVVQGKIGVQVLGEEPKFYEAGSTVTFPKGQAHKFWNAGTEPMVCKG